MNELSSKTKNDKEAIIRRLRKIEGQVKGIQNMVNNDKYCVDILIQIAAVRSALDKVGGIILENHIKGCVRNTIKTDDESKNEKIIDELISTITKFIK
ncbi:DNA-binding transcriptional regulator, FrmR family [Alkalithermobacter thermoalcaliphilus JW-YL-7 = DSM 7308]|uniref:DNA-binding transcriptional regulator, FrmR family n=1 Tax=Alkalithermobacter thermoalcaliphilus JW-YL-7 = DSM 7308 TaxID=1121328 RepID=A0A150FP73_CLOPD|nr:metal sensitive transcriptional repressor [[Clostridium] paradoxum JW-YL-7 = DSM 7308]SHK51646.1 DNA-binding transcriptional regulator, FrmR family [[Clostridium] paradoxum JW-YL-7 = DSM 7308]